MLEILSSLIQVNNGDVIQSLTPFFKKHTFNKYTYTDDNELYLNDQVMCIHKSTLIIDAIGTIVNLSDKKLCVCKRGNNSCIYLQKDNYYIFIKKTTNKQNDRIFYENLLKII